jgi:hypothetical protein
MGKIVPEGWLLPYSYIFALAARDKHSSLYALSVIDEEKCFIMLTPG